MTRVCDNKSAFYVVQFIDKPFESINDYVCVPYTWLIVSHVMNDKAIVAYPNDENPFNTRDRVKRKERYNDAWKFYLATVKHKSDSYNDAQSWIATKNDYGPLVKEESRVTDKQPKLSVNKASRSAYQPKRSRPTKMERNLAIDAQTPSNSIDQTRHLSTRSVQSLLSLVVSHNQSQNDSRVLVMHTENSRDQTAPLRSIGMTSQGIHRPRIHLESSTGNNNLDLTTKRVHYIDDGARSSVTGCHLNVMENASQRDEYIVKESRSPYHVVPSDSDGVRDHEEVSDRDRAADESPVERTDNVYGTANDPRHDSADSLTTDQNSTSTNHQTHSRFILEQQMLDNFGILFTEMCSTYRNVTDMYNTLRSLNLGIVETYKKLLGSVEQFNTAAGNTASSASPSSNLKHEGSRSPVTASATSSNQDQHRKDVAHKELYRFVLPPEYDADDTRWTLKYPTNLPGLAELMPQSGVYVSSGDLNHCKHVSKDCKSLACTLLPEVFSRNALSVCSSMTEARQAYNNKCNLCRPELDKHACSVLLNFVCEHGIKRGWNTDLEPILRILHCKMQEIRFKYGVLVEC